MGRLIGVPPAFAPKRLPYSMLQKKTLPKGHPFSFLNRNHTFSREEEPDLVLASNDNNDANSPIVARQTTRVLEECDTPGKINRRKMFESCGELGVPRIAKKAPTKTQTFALGSKR